MPGVHDPVKVDIAEAFPHKCAQCDSQTGPFAYPVGREVGGGWVFYLCVRCVQADGRCLGLEAGDEQAGLLRAVEQATDLQKQLDRMTKQRNAAKEKLALEQQTADLLAKDLSQARGRVDQLEAVIRQKAEADLAVVTS